MRDDYDVIVIGSGIGGLTTASLLAQIADKRVLVLESHFKIGGFTHSFQRKGYRWDVGLHYVGDMAQGSLPRQVMDYVTGGKVQWERMQGPLEHFIYPDHHLEIPPALTATKQLLKSEFPHCSQEIDRYFKLVHRARGWVKLWTICKQFPRWVGQVALLRGKRLATQTVKEVLERTISDPKLRGLLVSQRGNYGLPPGECAFGMHALVVSHYLEGGYVPIGGAEQIAKAVVPIIERHGGKCLVGHKVQKFIVQNGRVTSVVAMRKNQLVEFHAPLIISSVGAGKTFHEFLPEDLNVPERSLLHNQPAPPTTINVYLGLRDDPRKIGMDAGNYWIVESYDHDALRHQHHPEHGVQYGYGFLSCASLRDTQCDKHVAQIIFMSDYEYWKQWCGQPWLNRGASYDQRKHDVAEHSINIIEKKLPGFRDLVDYYEVSTPLTVESCVGHSGGAIYGIAATPDRFLSGGFHAQTSIKNLLLTGSDVGTFGIVGAMMSGVMTTSWSFGSLGLFTVMKSIKRNARVQRAAQASLGCS